jgi:uncharacterized membrane protein required for colicin V production
MHAKLNPFDLILAVILVIGVVRGRKRGISEELIDVVKWVALVVVCAFTYRMLGNLLATNAGFPVAWANVVSYLLIAVIVLFLGKQLKAAVGEKLVQGDTFGRLEFYLGMLAGALRFFCIALLFLALLNAKYSTPAERAAKLKEEIAIYGSSFFPSIESTQQMVFTDSISGKFIHEKLKLLLIEPVPPGPPNRETIGKRRERAVDEVFK